MFQPVGSADSDEGDGLLLVARLIALAGGGIYFFLSLVELVTTFFLLFLKLEGKVSKESSAARVILINGTSK